MTRGEAINLLADMDSDKYTAKEAVALTMAIKALETQPNDKWEGYSSQLYKNAYEEGKKDAEPRWIPITERLPKTLDNYLVQYPITDFGRDANGNYRQNIVICTYDPDKQDWYEHIRGWVIDNVVAWQPLPELWVDSSLPQKGDYGYYDGERWVKIQSIEMTGNAPVDIEDLDEVTYTTMIYPESGKPMVVKIPVNLGKTVYVNSESERD